MLSLGLLLQQTLGFVTCFLYASFFEWTFHRFVMHNPDVWSYPFRAHTLVHHGVFRFDRSYHLQRDEDKGFVTFAWWNAPVLLALHAPFVLGTQALSGLQIFWGGITAMCFYYFLYEYLHFVMHVPRNRWIERTALFRWLNAHHRNHHKRHDRNLNVVLPLPDWLFGTLVIPAKPDADTLRRECPRK